MSEQITTGWHYLKSGAPEHRRVGPLTWDELHGLSVSGSLWPIDLVWHPSLPQWREAGEVPGLFPFNAPGRRQKRALGTSSARSLEAAPAGCAQDAAPIYRPSWTASSRHRRHRLSPLLIPLLTLAVLGAGAAAYFAFWYQPAGGHRASTELGAAESRLPDPARLVATTAWGEVPANQICLMLAAGKNRSDAAAIAAALDGEVVGEIECIDAYLIQTAGSTTTDLRAALDEAARLEGVESAFPNLQTIVHAEIRGTLKTPLADPVYDSISGAGLDLVGVQKAWDYVRGSGLPLSAVHVGIVDTGIYRGTGEFGGDVSVAFPDKKAGALTSPEVVVETATGTMIIDPTGSHGTRVAGIVAADPANGGIAGIASAALGDLLTVSMIDMQTGQYGSPAEVTTDPADPSRATFSAGASYAFADLVAIVKEIEAGAQVVNCSWGNDIDHPDRAAAAAYEKFFTWMNAEHPDVVFVCSAGNDGRAVDGSGQFPGGSSLPNVITVGDVMNDGTTAVTSNTTNAVPGREFEVTLAAPGYEAVRGVDFAGEAVTTDIAADGAGCALGGTSLAAAHVSAAAALVLALDPRLTAAEIKQMLRDTARPGPPELGGGLLAIDQAVAAVANRERARLGLPQLSIDDLQRGGVIDAVAVGERETNVWMVKAIIEMLPSPKGTEVTITATEGTTIAGGPTRKISAPREVAWVLVAGPDGAEIAVTRADNGATAVILLGRAHRDDSRH